MKFEYDPLKSDANRVKHGIDFEAAQLLWNDDFRIEVPSQQQKGELRFLVIGTIKQKQWTAIITYRRRRLIRKTIRIISVRRARTNEVKRYEGRRDR